MTSESLSTKVFKFLKKQCILSFISIFILFFGSLLVFESKITPIYLTFPEPPELIGSLTPNDRLKNAKLLHFRKIKGPKSLVRVNGYIYSTTQDGKIVKFNDTHIEVFSSLYPGICKTVQECGRPLSIRYDEKNDRLLVVDAYHGLFQVNINTGISQRLFPISNSSFRVKFFNDFDILSTGEVIISESSTKYEAHNSLSVILEGRPNGRLLKVNPITGEYQEIIGNLYFPNGVQVHRKDANIVLVVETMKLRVLAVNINENCSISERTKVFLDSLPGFAENIRPSYIKPGYWINFSLIRHSTNSFWFDIMATFPVLRIILKKLFSDSIIRMMLSTTHGIILRIDEFGNLLESLHDLNGKNVKASSETLEFGNSLYLGNYYFPFLVKIDLN